MFCVSAIAHILRNRTGIDRPMPRHVAKANLPQKPCLACGRPFSWRKKWEKVWDEVRYCSEACKRAGSGGGR